MTYFTGVAPSQLSDQDTPVNNPLTDKDFVMPIAPRPELCFTQGKGHYLFDQNGKQYLDMVQGWAVNTLGHSPNLIQQALIEQSQQLINPGPGFFNQPMIELAKALCSHSDFDQVFFANSGAEANEGAIKLARKWGKIHKQGAFKIITFEQSFHGRTLATMSATGKTTFAPLFEPKVSGFSKAPYNDLAATEAVIDQHTVGIMLELVQGEAGVIPADSNFVKGLEALCKKHNLLLIIDEVQTGIGRTGNLFAYQGLDIQPDIMTLGKGLGGGVPISALLTKAEHSCFEYGDQGGTYNGNPLMCSVSQAVVNKVLEQGFLANVEQMGQLLSQKLTELSQQYSLGSVRGKGLLIALDTSELSASELVDKARELGLLLNAPNERTLRFIPALNLSEKEIDQCCSILAKTIESL